MRSVPPSTSNANIASGVLVSLVSLPDGYRTESEYIDHRCSACVRVCVHMCLCVCVRVSALNRECEKTPTDLNESEYTDHTQTIRAVCACARVCVCTCVSVCVCEGACVCAEPQEDTNRPGRGSKASHQAPGPTAPQRRNRSAPAKSHCRIQHHCQSASFFFSLYPLSLSFLSSSSLFLYLSIHRSIYLSLYPSTYLSIKIFPPEKTQILPTAHEPRSTHPYITYTHTHTHAHTQNTSDPPNKSHPTCTYASPALQPPSLILPPICSFSHSPDASRAQQSEHTAAGHSPIGEDAPKSAAVQTCPSPEWCKKKEDDEEEEEEERRNVCLFFFPVRLPACVSECLTICPSIVSGCLCLAVCLPVAVCVWLSVWHGCLSAWRRKSEKEEHKRSKGHLPHRGYQLDG